MRESAIPQHPCAEENRHQMATLLPHHVRDHLVDHDDLVGQRSAKQDDVEQHVHRVHVDTNISKILDRALPALRTKYHERHDSHFSAETFNFIASHF